MFVQWWRYRCPHCGKHYATTIVRNPVWLGTGTRHCNKCGREFPDGSREWDVLTGQQKFIFFFPDHPLLWIALGIFAAWRLEAAADPYAEILPVAAAFVVLMTPFWILRQRSRQASLRRVAMRQFAVSGDRF